MSATCPDLSKQLKKYRVRPGPPRPANQAGCRGKKARGNNGLMYQSTPDANGVYRWKKLDKAAPAKKAPAKRKAPVKKKAAPKRAAPRKAPAKKAAPKRAPAKKCTLASIKALCRSCGITGYGNLKLK